MSVHFLGIDSREKDINSHLKCNESDMPDEVYNNAGYRIANFYFKILYFFYCTDKTLVYLIILMALNFILVSMERLIRIMS
ncbi:hypothetical protein Pcaca04_27570 [Pectobacterium carotovorum subsp. carotovorum]|nr:hypothetical protein Pcaca04_27570 [Pectobacterium carotovorum subsp. carotovorum]